MPIRRQSDPLVSRLGKRFYQLRTEHGHSLKSVTRTSKGYLSQFENGLALPSVLMLDRLAQSLGMDLVDLVNFPECGVRNQLLEQTRGMGTSQLKRLLALASCDDQTLTNLLAAKDTRCDPRPGTKSKPRARSTPRRQSRTRR